ncbi:MAG: hypothetical protein N2201_04330 [candidate division WOR-3 bacterium]|nr:hypothetical protein [candidate division WOR-3 bacterium]
MSGGQKQHLFIALSLINNPEVVFLDELTTGLDPQIWDLVKTICDQGKTIFLTTHYMDEAKRLCDRVGIIDNGKIVALDTPKNLIHKISAENRIIFTVENSFPKEQLKIWPV